VPGVHTIVKNAKYNENGTWENTVGWLMFYEGVSLEDGKHRVGSWRLRV
jgi:hypothetical protein